MANHLDSLNVNKRDGQAGKWAELRNDILKCGKCPRLLQHCQKVAREKKNAYRDETYWGKPVPGFGDPNASVWLIGLAPGAHGANRTGRMFTGDKSGEWLYRALFESGFCNQPDSKRAEDDLQLNSVYISAAGRCAPPDNRPSKEELKNCFSFLAQEFELLRGSLKTIVCLGNIGFETTLHLLRQKQITIPKPKPKFSHGKWIDLGAIQLLTSYHPSQQNTATRKLTWEMWTEIFKKLKYHTSRERDFVGTLS